MSNDIAAELFANCTCDGENVCGECKKMSDGPYDERNLRLLIDTILVNENSTFPQETVNCIEELIGLRAKNAAQSAEIVELKRDQRRWENARDVWRDMDKRKEGNIAELERENENLKAALNELKIAANEVLCNYMPNFIDSRTVDDCLVGLAGAVHDAEKLTEPKSAPSLEALATRNDLNFIYWSAYHAGHHDTVEGQYTDVAWNDRLTYHDDAVDDCIKSCIASHRGAFANTAEQSPAQSTAEQRWCFACNKERPLGYAFALCEECRALSTGEQS